jgi:spore maturation protein CgeB
MKFFHCSSLYGVFVRQLFERVQLESQTYDMLMDKIVATRVGWSDYWITWMKPLGWEGKLVFGNCDIVQKAWWRENKKYHSEPVSLKNIALEQIRAFQPDVVFIEDLYFYDHEFRREARKILPHARFIGWRFAPHRMTDCFDVLDGLVTGAKPFVDEFRHLGIPCEVVPLAFDTSLLKEVKILGRDVPISFAGQVGGRSAVHSGRYTLILSLLKHTGMQIRGMWIPESNPFSFLHAAKWFRQYRETSFLRKRIQSPVFGLNYFELLARSQIVFNAHIDVAANFAGNMRMFETSGMGACLVTDWKSNIGDFFEPDVEVVCYRTDEQAMEKITYLVEHPQEARKIAERGQRHTLTEHTYEKRAPLLDEFFQRILNNKQ